MKKSFPASDSEAIDSEEEDGEEQELLEDGAAERTLAAAAAPRVASRALQELLHPSSAALRRSIVAAAPLPAFSVRRAVDGARRGRRSHSPRKGVAVDEQQQQQQQQQREEEEEEGDNRHFYVNPIHEHLLLTSPYRGHNNNNNHLLRYSCPVFVSLCDSVVNMISAACKSTTEHFARSLQSKLHYLSQGDRECSLEHDRSRGGGKHINNNNNTTTTNAEEEISGTTFPPRQLAHFDLLKAKYHSESDLTPEKLRFLGHGRKFEDDDEDDQQLLEASIDNNKKVDAEDSDLFFDFDIGSPEEENADDEDIMRRTVSESTSSSIRRGSLDSNDYVLKSAFYGSASSGLCSDMGTDHHEDDPVVGGVGLDIDCDEWREKLKSDSGINTAVNECGSGSSSKSTPIAPQSPAPAAVDDEPLVSPDSLLDDPEATNRIINNGADDHDEGDEAERQDLTPCEEQPQVTTTFEADPESGTFSLVSGESRHKIANSKLNSLLALLEKDREKDYPTIRTGSGSSPPRKVSYKSPMPTISASPANFSFLSNQPELGAEETKFERCDSTPVLSSSDRAFISSPQLNRKTATVVEPDFAALVQHNQSGDSPKDDDDDQGLLLDVASEKPDKMRRASSLRSGKTPPGTPGRRKIVRFADVFGLDLADVKTFLDEVPRVPRSAYRDLKDAELSDIESEAGSVDSGSYRSSNSNMKGNVQYVDPAEIASLKAMSTPDQPTLIPMFNQPGGSPSFFDVVREKKICLENAYMANEREIKGTIRVQNISFEKKVIVRYSVNEWIKSEDVEAEYKDGSCDGFSDKFTFLVKLPALTVGQRVQFCLRFIAGGQEFWDNNDGKNYVFQLIGSNAGGTAAAAAGSARSTSAPIATSSPRPTGFGSSQTSTTYSHSPSAMQEDPWLRYL